jgi:hypothetical protein
MSWFEEYWKIEIVDDIMQGTLFSRYHPKCTGSHLDLFLMFIYNQPYLEILQCPPS